MERPMAEISSTQTLRHMAGCEHDHIHARTHACICAPAVECNDVLTKLTRRCCCCCQMAWNVPCQHCLLSEQVEACGACRQSCWRTVQLPNGSAPPLRCPESKNIPWRINPCLQVPPEVLGGAKQACAEERQGQPPDHSVAWQRALASGSIEAQLRALGAAWQGGWKA